MATPTKVQNTQAAGGGVSSVSVTLSSVAAGNFLWVGLACGQNPSTAPTLSDTNGTVSTAIAVPVGNNAVCGQYYVESAASGTHTITATLSKNDNLQIFGAEYSGVASPALDGTPPAVLTGSGTTIATNSATPSGSGDLAIGLCAQAFAGSTFSAWTNGFTQEDYGNANTSAAWADLVYSSTAAISTGCTASGTSANSGSIALFKAASGGGGAVSGSGAAAESADTASGTGTLAVSGTAAAAEATDIASGSGAISISGAGSAAEGADTASGSGTTGSSISGSGAATEGADTASGAGSVSTSGTGAATEAGDAASATGSVSVSGAATVTEGADAASGAGTLSVSGTAAAAEGADAASGTGSVSLSGSGAAAESADSARGSGTLAGGSFGAPGSIPGSALYTIRRQLARNFSVWRDQRRIFAVHRIRVRVFEVNSVSLRFPVKGPAESVPLTFDFSADLPSGVTLTGAPTLSIECTEGTDANAANVIAGAKAFNAANTGVVQDAAGGVDGCEYTITCTSPTTQANLTLSLVGILPVRANLN